MKKAVDASPNRALKHERELRCWSQLEVADRIGTTAFNVSRWERGITFPSAYFRQQLCQLFAKTPQELGFLAGENELSPVATPEEPEPGPAANTETDLEPERHAEADSMSGHNSVSLSLPVRDPEALPAVWNIPYRRNPFFTDRTEVLQALYTGLHVDNPALPQALSGLGGIGKTQTAIEYAYRYRHLYQVVLWARAATRELLTSDFTSLAALLSLPEKDDQDQSHAVAAVKRWLSGQRDWLLVLDNADDLGFVGDFLPEILNGHLILTTQAQSMGHIAQRIPMQKLKVEDGMMFLLRRSKLLASSASLTSAPDTYRSQARAIAHTMDGLPLALDQAAAYIEETGCGLAGYAARYQRRSIALLYRRGGLHPEHTESVVATWSLSFEKIERAYPAAAELLRLCAFLHPDSIAEEVFVRGVFECTPDLDLLATDPFEMDDAIGVLTTFSLVSRDPDCQTLSLHRLVQVVLREQMNEATQMLWAERAVRVVERAFPEVSFTSWQACQQCLPHALNCAQLIAQLHMTLPEAVRLLNKTGSYLRERAQYAEAAALLTQALSLSEEILAPDSPLLAESLNNLGMLAHAQGKYAWSETLLLRALPIYKQVWGTEHTAVAQCLSNLAENYRVQARHAQGEELVMEALAIRERLLGSEHPDVAKSLNHLASLYQSQGKYSLAEPLYLRALSIRQRALGPDHVDVAEDLNDLANLYCSQGKYARAEPLYQQTLAFCRKSLGPHHVYTAITLINLAEIRHALGQYDEAGQLHREALETLELTLGLHHPHVGKSLNFLAEIALMQQEYAETETLASRALAIWQQAQGQNHHREAVSLDILARLRRVQGAFEEAEALVTRALAIYQDLWGSDSRYLTNSLNTLAEILYAQADYSRAEELLQQALQIQERVWEGAHPDMARSLANLAVLYQAQGDYAQADLCFARAIAIRREAFSSEHPDLVAVLQLYAAFLRQTGDLARLRLLEARFTSDQLRENIWAEQQ